MASDGEDSIAFAFNGTTIYDSDIQTLAEEEWLGDAIIMLLFSLLEHQAHAADVELWSPPVVQLLCTMDDDDLDPSTSASLFPAMRTFNILPISDAYASSTGPTLSSHWSLLLLLCPPPAARTHNSRLRAYHLDSLDPHNAPAAARCAAHFAAALGLLPSPVRAVAQRGWATTSRRDEAVLAPQRNAWDCGIYVLALTQALVDGLSCGDRDTDTADVEALLACIVGGDSTDSAGGDASPRQIARFRSAFYHWVRKWQAEARRGGGKWDSRDEVVGVLGPWV